MKDSVIQARVGGTLLQVPIVDSPETTQGIIEAVNERLAEIERQSDRIDSQRFALQAAVSFASELAELKLNAEADQRELLHVLDKIASVLRDAVARANELADNL